MIGGFIVGMVFGGTLGVALMCVMFVARDMEEEETERAESIRTGGAK